MLIFTFVIEIAELETVMMTTNKQRTNSSGLLLILSYSS